MNIIKKHYAIKQCEKLDELISIQTDICKALEFGYNLCADFDCIVHYAQVYLKDDKHIQDTGYLDEKYKGDKLEAVREIKIGWDCYKNEHRKDVTVFGDKKILGIEEDCYITWEGIDEDFQFFWKDYEAYKTKAENITQTVKESGYALDNLHCVADLEMNFDYRFNCKCLSTRLTEHLCMIRSFKFAQDAISEGHWIKNQWSKNSWILNKKEKTNFGMNAVADKIGSDVEKAKNTGEVKINPDCNNQKVNVKCYRDNGDGTMDWVDCPVISTDDNSTVICTDGNNDGTTEEYFGLNYK